MTVTLSLRAFVITLALAPTLLPTAPAQEAGAAASSFLAKTLRQKEKEELGLLLAHARWCLDRGLYDRADDALDEALRLAPKDPGVDALVQADRDEPDRSNTLGEDARLARELRKREDRLRERRARAEVTAATRLRRRHPGESTAAYRRALRHDPGDARARKALGFVEVGKIWCLPGEEALVRAGFTRLAPDLWAPKGFHHDSENDEFDVGERSYTRKEAERIHSSPESPWTFYAAGIEVRTTLPFDEACRIAPAAARARRLARRLLALPAPRPEKRQEPLVTRWLRDADQLALARPGIEQSIWFDADEIVAYTRGRWRTEELVRGTAVHSLLLTLDPDVGRRSGLWLVHGLSELFYCLDDEATDAAVPFDLPRIRRIYAPLARRWLDRSGKTPLAALEALTKVDWSEGRSDWRDASVAFTAWLWGVAPDRRPHLLRYFRELLDGKGRPGRFAKVFGKEPDHFREPFEGWLQAK